MSSFALCLHASAKTPKVYLVRDGALLPPAPPRPDLGDPAAGASLDELVGDALAHAGAAVNDIERIVLDIGPGRLSAVRAATSFANALAFAADLPVLPVVSAAAVGLAAERRHGAPAVVAYKAAGGTAYIGLVRNGALAMLRHGPLADTLAAVVASLPAFCLAGLAIDVAEAAAPEANIVDAGGVEIAGETFAALLAAAADDAYVREPVQPITEQSELVNV